MAYSRAGGHAMSKLLAGALVCALIWCMIWGTGCGADPVRADLEAYQREVLDPLGREESAGAAELSAALADLTAGRVDARAAQRVYRDRLAERYRALAAKLTAYRAATHELAQLNARLAGQYEQVAQELDRAATHLGRDEWSGFAEAHARIGTGGLESVRSELTALAAQHGFDLAGK